MSNENIRTSALMRGSFLAAAKVGQIFENGTSNPGAMTLTSASAAGLLLELFGTTVRALEAFDRLPSEGPWPRAQRYLEQLRAAELAETLPPIAETGT